MPTGEAPPPSAPWSELLADLRHQFLREAVPRLASVGELIEHLVEHPADSVALLELHRRFHGFAGSGTTYGLPEVSAQGARGEQLCQSLIAGGRAPGAEDLAVCRLAREAIEQELARARIKPAHERRIAAPTKAQEVLVVDDDPEFCRIADRVLEHEGMKVRNAAGFQEALAEIKKQQPDIVVVDLYLPDGSGYELIQKLRSHPDGEGLVVLVVSVRNDFEGRLQAVTAGADGYFEKPVDWEVLLRRLHQVVERTPNEPGRILSVEDDPQQASFLRAVLESGGYEYTLCSDAAQFESLLVATKPDLVLMDVNLPGCSGYDLVRYVRQDERYATLPILFLTTESELRAHMESARAGGDEHLVKPVAPGLLLATVAARVERARFLKGLLERDGLTQLLTHTACQERAKALVTRRKRYPGRQAAWVMLDIDNFKAINDLYGHPAGDKVLVALSGLLRRRLRQSDTVARYGGEEFVILLEDLEEVDALRLVTRLLHEFSGLPHRAADGTTFQVTFSAGVAMLEPGTMGVEGWKQAADDALYEAKAAGRNRVVGAPAGRALGPRTVPPVEEPPRPPGAAGGRRLSEG